MKRPLLLALIGGAIVVATGVATVRLAFVAPSKSPGGVVLLRPGQGAVGVARDLHRAGIIQNRVAFVAFARLTGADRDLRAGRYDIPPAQSLRDLIAMLRAGPNIAERVTIVEGSRADEIARLLATTVGVDSASFMRIVHDPSSPSKFGTPGPTLEGYLFPDTYELTWGLTAEEVVTALVKEYRKAFSGLSARADSMNLTEREVVTLASIIEAETGIPDERPRVAAVFHNRLRAGWKLEADPTVRYASGNSYGEISRADLEFDSPYNSYLYGGLPPGPIGNPGRDALVAAVYPSPGCADFFFVATGEGGHYFSRTLDEHNAAKARAKRNGTHD